MLEWPLLLPFLGASYPVWAHAHASIIQEDAAVFRVQPGLFSYVAGNDAAPVWSPDPSEGLFCAILSPPLMRVFLGGKHTTHRHKSPSSSFQLRQEMTHIGGQRLISVYPRGVEPVRVYLTGQALK